MTREDLIFELKKRCSFWLNNKTISKKHALECLLGILENEESKPSLPSNLDEAADKYAKENCENYVDEEDGVTYIEEALRNTFKAGANWMAGQGVTLNLSIDEFSCGAYNACVEQGLTSEDEVIVQIRKK